MYELVIIVILLGVTDAENESMQRVVTLPFAPVNGTTIRLSDRDNAFVLDYDLDGLFYNVDRNAFYNIEEESVYRDMMAEGRELDAGDELERVREIYHQFGFTDVTEGAGA